MPTADEARAELARRELARRAAVRDGSGIVGAVRNLGAARARSDTSPRPAPPRPQESRRERSQREGEAYAARARGGDVQQALGSGVLRGLGGMADTAWMGIRPAEAFAGGPMPSAILNELGWGYTPQTDAGSLAEGAGMMLPNALAPGSALARTAAVALPTLAGEAARIGTRELGYDEQSQENMRGLAQFAGGLATGFAPQRGAAAAARPPATSARPARVGLPSSNSLALPDVPTVEQMRNLSRVERVPLSAARGRQRSMYWDEFNKGDHPGELIPGYGDRPVAVLREDGEYIIYDGNHRATLALNAGADDLEMYVVRARDYAPELAGRPAAPRRPNEDQELLAMLREELAPQAPPAASRRPAPPRVRPPSDRAVLRGAGVSLTPGQSVPFFKLGEDIAARAPILGGAIRGARARGGESFNRATANRALEPLGETVPEGVRTGPESIAYVERRLGQAFEDAYALTPSVVPDEVFDGALSAATARARVLPTERIAAVQRRLDAALEPLRRGDLTGAEAGRIRSQLAKEATDFIKKGGEEGDVGRVIRSVGDALDDLIARSDPTGRAGPALELAREGWGSYAVLRRAGSNANTGIFTPGQLATAVRAEAPSRAAVARGEARLQDLSGAAARVMPDSFGNPGTGDVTSTLALLGLTATNPVAGASAAVGLTAAAAPYWAMARNIAAKVPPNASRAQAQAAAGELSALAQNAPPDVAAQILAIRDAMLRAAPVAAIAGSSAASQAQARPSPPR